MCFYYQVGQEIQIADLPITVFKVCLVVKDGRASQAWTGPIYRQVEYVPNNVYGGVALRPREASGMRGGGKDRMCIEEGFHSWSTPEQAAYFLREAIQHALVIETSDDAYEIVQFEIPRGAAYIGNWKGEYVSGEIRCVRRLVLSEMLEDGLSGDPFRNI